MMMLWRSTSNGRASGDGQRAKVRMLLLTAHAGGARAPPASCLRSCLLPLPAAALQREPQAMGMESRQKVSFPSAWDFLGFPGVFGSAELKPRMAALAGRQP